MKGIAKICILLIICVVLSVVSCVRIPLCRANRSYNPLLFGLKNARTGTERYYVLQKTHEEAYRLGIGVSYAGIKEIELEIPSDAQSIPLTQYTDFAGVTFKVKNTQKNFHLFSLTDEMKPIIVDGIDIDNRDFSQNPLLRKGIKLLVISDKTLWVENRTGYNYGATRKDIMLVKNGKSVNGPIQSYCTPASSPECQYCEPKIAKKVIKNVDFCRTSNSTKKTYFIKIENQYNVELSKVNITTSYGSGLYADKAIEIANCVDVTLEGVTINGTYSLPKKYGYGVSMDNIYQLQVKNMFARANWGVFGDNNIHKAVLANCDINRFDIHCYGKDVSFENCNFVDLYNQFSSIYGEVVFNNCTFTEFTPVLIEGTYNALTAFDIVFENCTFNLDKNHKSIFTIYGFNKLENSRPELKEKCLPNITMLDCQVNMADDMKGWNIYNTDKINGYEGCFSYISKVLIKGLSSNVKVADMNVFSKHVNTSNEVRVAID